MPRFLIKASLPFFLILIGAGLLSTGLRRPVLVIEDGQPKKVLSRAFQVRNVLEDAGISVSSFDRVEPSLMAWLGWRGVIVVTHAKPVNVWVNQRLVFSEKLLPSLPGDLLYKAGLRLFPGDKVFSNGLEVIPGMPLPGYSTVMLQLNPGRKVSLQRADQQLVFYSSAGTLAGALWEQGYLLSAADRFSLPPSEPLQDNFVASLRSARPMRIENQSDGVEIQTAVETVGQALMEAGLSLQGLDYSLPFENEPLPPDGLIRVVKVDEAIALEQKLIPYTTEFVADPETELDQRSEVQPGQFGVEVIRKRIRVEDEQTVDELVDSQWTASQPRPRKLGYGTQVVIRKLETPQGTLEYWRAVQMYATAYSPCGLGNVTKCYYGTSLGLPVQRGVVAVTYAWYLQMAGQQVYVPGYGSATIADVGGGIRGRYWIDLGFTDADLEEWHQWVTVYFLTPVPETIPWILP